MVLVVPVVDRATEVHDRKHDDEQDRERERELQHRLAFFVAP
jgi:hypothetical protein